MVGLAHFLGGEPDYYERVGFHPTEENDETFIDVEPNTGVVLRAARRMQVNVPIKKYPLIKGFDDVPTMFYPVMWLNEVTFLNYWQIVDLSKF